MELAEVATYRRVVAADEVRVWENVLDWEHLPWLHRSSFASIALDEAGDWGWRARAALRTGGEPFDLELIVDRARSRYVTRTLTGALAGAEIWTRVTPEDAERIFDAYVQAGETPRDEGLGLGLAICRRLIEAHGGRIRLLPSAGPGACFGFTLPSGEGAHA